MKRFRTQDDPWWGGFREDLETIAAQLELANRGTLLGPPLMRGRTGRVDMRLEMPPGTDPMAVFKPVRDSGKHMTIKVNYLDKLPVPLESEAQIWSLTN